MPLRINDEAPNFTADTTEGEINFHDWIGDGWAILCSHPKDFTPVCTTELGYMAGLKPEFDQRNCKIIGISVDPVDKNREMSDKLGLEFALLSDPALEAIDAYGVRHVEGGMGGVDIARGVDRSPANSTGRPGRGGESRRDVR